MTDSKEDPPFIGDWYREKKLGSGGFGVVTLWKNNKTNEHVAIKRCHIRQDGSEMTDKHCERWKNEVELMTNSVKNEHIVKTLKIEPESFLKELKKVSPNKLPILCMEYCELGDLRRVLNKTNACSGLPEGDVRDILLSLRNAISYLHSLKITHRDIKPENIVLKQIGHKTIYKLTDLGYAKVLDRQSLNASLVGTVEYLAPDLLYCDRYNCSVDYWSFGIIAFEIITGIRPFIPHASIAKWMLHVQQKKQNHISITEDNNENYVYHSYIFSENHISQCFQNCMDKWLVLALEWNPKQRGFVFQVKPKEVTGEVKPQKTVKFADTVAKDDSPTQVLKIFSLLDNILEKKILTIFSLFTFSSLSVEINEKTTMSDLLDVIEEQTGILKELVEFILPLEQKIDKIDPTSTKPIDLFIPDFYGKPMLFVAKKGFILNNDIKPKIPKSISDVFQNIKIKLKVHVLKQFITNSYYFIRNEQNLYITALDGIKNYGLFLNDEILKCRTGVNTLNKLSCSMNGGMEYHKIIMCHTKEKIEAKMLTTMMAPTMILWEEQSAKIEGSIYKLLEVTDRIIKRYESVLKRSRDIVSHSMLKNIDQDYYNIKSLDSRFEIVRAQIIEKKTHEKSHIDMLQSVYECLKKRDILLRDFTFKELQQQLVDIKIEMQEIKKALTKAVEHAEKYKKELTKISLEHHDNIWNLMENLTENRMATAIEDYVPDLDKMMNSMNLEENKPAVPSFDLGGSVTNLQNSLGSSMSKSLLCFGEGPEINSLLHDNEALMMTMADLINDGFELTQ